LGQSKKTVGGGRKRDRSQGKKQNPRKGLWGLDWKRHQIRSAKTRGHTKMGRSELIQTQKGTGHPGPPGGMCTTFFAVIPERN